MAAQNVTGTITINTNFIETGTGFPSGLQISQNVQVNNNLAFATGAANSIDTLYAATLSLAGAATHLNLHTGLTDPLGNAIAFARVRYWIVQVTTLTAGVI